jgi:hypothetical protein
MMATLAQINARIRKAGFLDVEMVKGDGYIYLVFDDGGPNYETESIMTPYINAYTCEEWVETAVEFGTKMRAQAVERAAIGPCFSRKFTVVSKA